MWGQSYSFAPFHYTIRRKSQIRYPLGRRWIFAQYQIRFLGCKGVVSVDSRLEGIHMCVRPSMKKFNVPGEEHGTIEIAQAFSKPNIPYLNRLVSVFAHAEMLITLIMS